MSPVAVVAGLVGGCAHCFQGVEEPSPEISGVVFDIRGVAAQPEGGRFLVVGDDGAIGRDHAGRFLVEHPVMNDLHAVAWGSEATGIVVVGAEGAGAAIGR